MNYFKVYINGKPNNYKSAVFPLKYGDFLDEQLDYATLFLSRTTARSFRPLTPVSIDITSVTEATGTNTIRKNYLVSTDNTVESPVGSNVFNHQITLIEETKYLEGFLVESLCVTNANGRNYTRSYPALENVKCDWSDEVKVSDVLPESFKTPAPSTNRIKLPSIFTTYEKIFEWETNGFGYCNINVTVSYQDGTSENFNYSGLDYNASPGSFYPKVGLNKISWKSSVNNGQNYLAYDTYIYGIPNKYPMKQWTIKEVIERALQLAEPLTVNGNGEYIRAPRFTFNDQGEDIFNQESPEFTFTRCTLRELLQVIGGYIHAEPRLSGSEITFDRYGGTETAQFVNVLRENALWDLEKHPYGYLSESIDLENCCTQVESYVDNIVNQISEGQHTVAQPFGKGSQTLRSDESAIRVEDNSSAYFKTDYPINKVTAFYYIDGNGNEYDITGYLFESSIYNSQLNSYSQLYPVSKVYALNYSQGGQKIGGFFYKKPEWFSSAIKDYAITNILNAVTDATADSYDYPNLQFRIVYEPIYSERVTHGKQNITEWLNFPRSISHSQSDNQVESRFYGENIKGLAERLGNREKTVTFRTYNVNNIPKAGTKWDEEYYISSVAVEVDMNDFGVTIGLTKNFNRLSQYIGAKSYKRIYEVSETMVASRETYYKDYCVLTASTDTPTNAGDCWIKSNTTKGIACIFGTDFNSLNIDPRITAAIVKGYGKTIDRSELPSVILPVISSGFGNVMQFSWSYKDNFSAGVQVIKNTQENTTTYYTQDLQYSDYYGRMYYSTTKLVSITYQNNLQSALSLPSAEDISDNHYENIAGTQDSTYQLVRKDSREALKCNYAIEFVTDMPGAIIGSVMANKNPLVAGLPDYAGAKFVLLDDKINKFSQKIDAESILTSKTFSTDGEARLFVYATDISFAGIDGTNYATAKAWAVMTPITQGTPYTVQDEDGNISTITPTYGGDLLFGQNLPETHETIIGAFHLVFCHDIFSYKSNK